MIFDIPILILLSLFSFLGFYRGFTRELAGILIFFVATIFSIHFSIPIDYILSQKIPFQVFNTVVSHLIVFALIALITKVFFIKSILIKIRLFSIGMDGMLGFLLGFIKGLIATLLVYSCIFLSGSAESKYFEKSKLLKAYHSVYQKVSFLITDHQLSVLEKVKNKRIDYDKEEAKQSAEKLVTIVDNGVKKAAESIRSPAVNDKIEKAIDSLPNELLDVSKNIDEKTFLKEKVAKITDLISSHMADLDANDIDAVSLILNDFKVSDIDELSKTKTDADSSDGIDQIAYKIVDKYNYYVGVKNISPTEKKDNLINKLAQHKKKEGTTNIEQKKEIVIDQGKNNSAPFPIKKNISKATLTTNKVEKSNKPISDQVSKKKIKVEATDRENIKENNRVMTGKLDQKSSSPESDQANMDVRDDINRLLD